MSRLLHAAARGARIERKHYSFKSYWEEARMVWAKEPKDCDYDYRIHPEDEHLQYGPISTALREAAASGSAWDLSDVYGRMAMGYACHHHYNWDWQLELHRSLFLLILSEALADDGL